MLASCSLCGAWDGSRTPLDSGHLVIIRPSDFDFAEPVSIADSTFGGKAILVSGERLAHITVKYEGSYALWIRCAERKGTDAPLEIEFLQKKRTILRTTLMNGEGGAGPRGYEAYRKEAIKASPAGEGLTPAEEEKADTEFLETIGEKGQKSWFSANRLEHPEKKYPFYWWKAGTLRLSPGRYALRIKPLKELPPELSPVFDCAFLTTVKDLVYPFKGDIDAPKASYIRFRIDELNGNGLKISASIRIHYDPWRTPRVWLNPDGMDFKTAEPHTKTGFTPWYRLQDIKFCPGFGSTLCHLLLSLSPSEGAKGVTQFAVFPHGDFVLREINWREPDGLGVSMRTDFETYLHQLRTFRDHARENYERALRATSERLFPLAREGLYFLNGWGSARGAAFEYMLKTLRLLGFNTVSAPYAPIKARKLYGWMSSGGQYWPPPILPFNEQEVVEKYDAYYAKYFGRNRDFYRAVSIFQIADEPTEIATYEMSSPIWIYDEKEEKWVDPVGGSVLASRTDLTNCVLEGEVEKHGRTIEFRVAVDHPLKPTRYAYWKIGRVGPSIRVNLAVGRVGLPGSSEALMGKPTASVSTSPTPFKIVYEAGSSALYIRGRLVHQHNGLPERGGFALAGSAKAISSLKLRPIGKDEHIVPPSRRGTAGTLERAEQEEEALDELFEPPEWAKQKPLKQFIEEDWVVGGGMPQAHSAFRKWCLEQGLAPRFFGKKSWDELRMLTLPSLVRNKYDARIFYWSRRFSGYLTPRMFGLSADAIHNHAPNPKMKGFVALSGHDIYFPSRLPLDMFQLARSSKFLIPGISDWMTLGSWRWDSHQAVAFSVAPYNAGARRYGSKPLSFPMMHCVYPSVLRSYTMLANQVKVISFWTYGPSYAVTEGFWSESEGCYRTVHLTNNYSAQLDDILRDAVMRPSRVAMLYAMSTEYWAPLSSFADKRATFLALSHEYYQPELVTEGQILEGALQHYDALYVLDPYVRVDVQDRIGEWVRRGGLLCTYADSLLYTEFNEPRDLVKELMGITRKFTSKVKKPPRFAPVKGELHFRPHTVSTRGMPSEISFRKARIRALYNDREPAWMEKTVGKGKMVYIAHRPGLTYTSKAVRLGGYPTVWADTGRATLLLPLKEANISRQLILSEPLVMASALSSSNGTVIILYNMQPNPLHNLSIKLREEKRPLAVQFFEDDRLAPLAFEYSDRWVRINLDKLSGGQMIVVRNSPPPPDNRLSELRRRTLEQLQSADWQTLSAGAWFAGFFPQWRLAEKLIPLLEHPRWEVRRVSAESLGRLGYKKAIPCLLRALKRETDAHALGDELFALARLGAREVPELCRKFIKHNTPFVRIQAIHSAQFLELRSVRDVIDLALSDPDFRIKSKAMKLIAGADPRRALRLAVEALKAGIDLPISTAWARFIAENDNTLQEYLRQGMPGGDDFLISIARFRQDPRIATALKERLPQIASVHPRQFVSSVLTQRNKALGVGLLKLEGSLHETVRAYLPLILEYCFGSRLGNNLNDWKASLQPRSRLQ